MFSAIYPYLSLLFSALCFYFLQFTIFDSISLQPAGNIIEIKKKLYQARRNEKTSGGGGYQLCNVVGHHGWPTKKIFHFKSSKTASKT